MSASIALRLGPDSPTGIFQLSSLDQISPRCYMERLFCFEILSLATVPGVYVPSIVTLCLERALKDFPCLVSQINISCPSRNSLLLKVDAASESTLLIKDYTDSSLKHMWTLGDFKHLSSLGFPSSVLPRSLLLPDLPCEPGPGPIPASYFQLSCIPGGLILGIGVHNSVCDMYGIGCLVRDLSFRMEALLTREQMVDFSLGGDTLHCRNKFRREVSGTLMTSKIWNATKTRPFSFYAYPNRESYPRAALPWPVVWRIARESLSKLRELYIRSTPWLSGHVKSDEISNNTLVTGCLWICINNARGLVIFGLNQSTLRASMDLRSYTGCEFFYVGNACLDYNVDVWPKIRLRRPHVSFGEALVIASSAIHNVSKSIGRSDLKDVLNWMEIREKFEAKTNLPKRLDPPDIKIHNQAALDIAGKTWEPVFGQPEIRVADGFDQGDCVFLSTHEDKQFEILTNLTESETIKLAQYSEFREYFMPCASDPATSGLNR